MAGTELGLCVDTKFSHPASRRRYVVWKKDHRNFFGGRMESAKKAVGRLAWDDTWTGPGEQRALKALLLKMRS